MRLGTRIAASMIDVQIAMQRDCSSKLGIFATPRRTGRQGAQDAARYGICKSSGCSCDERALSFHSINPDCAENWTEGHNATTIPTRCGDGKIGRSVEATREYALKISA